jgi:hypothetical protein
MARSDIVAGDDALAGIERRPQASRVGSRAT